ncbi:DUF370 domain-containing protein [Eubacteriales bacterium OttesenSCG-928-N14]|nr:DUF370 domain-containing protein [Eubacteriales bacterium OttesenSCG-928-N14]
MILHMGGDAVVSTKDIVMILDVAALSSKATKQYVEQCKDEGRYIQLEPDDCKSIIIAKENGGTMVYVSPISAATLHKRCENTQIKDRY